MIILTKNEIDELRGIQEELDNKILSDVDIIFSELFKCKVIALKTEMYEFVNEIESFKYWKKNKNKTKQLEEASDMLHFILSIANMLELELEDIRIKDIDVYNDCTLNVLTMKLDKLTYQLSTDSYSDFDEVIMQQILEILVTMLGKIGYTSRDLIDAYIEKNEENHNRQLRNY